MAFPTNPVNGQQYTTNIGQLYAYDSTRTAWLIVGTTGIQGATGIGFNGTTGVQGVTGIQGQGTTGLQGLTGIQGMTGVQGTTGVQGQGTTGVQGQTGVQGMTGVQGTTGVQGATGVQGTTGVQGQTGVQGTTGVQGATGLGGTTGVQGTTGIQGQGTTGIQGVTGIQGQTGLTGVTGLPGHVDQRLMTIKVCGDNTLLTVGDGRAVFTIPYQLDAYTMTDADAAISTYATDGTPTIQLYNVTDSTDILSTRITIDASEYTSYTAVIQPVILNGGVSTGDQIRIDCDATGTGSKGLEVILRFD